MGNPYSQLGPDDFQQAGLKLLPPGRAWPRDPNTVLGRVVAACADLWARLHRDISVIVDLELDPVQTSALLPEWEIDYGLPDHCSLQGQTNEQRRQAVIAKITGLGSLARSKYIALAGALGYAVTITEYKPFTCVSSCTDILTGENWRYAWQVNAPATTINVMTCMSACNSPLRWWGNDLLECVIRRANRASRVVLFSYGD